MRLQLPTFFLNCLPQDMNALRSTETAGTIRPTSCVTPQNLQIKYVNNYNTWH